MKEITADILWDMLENNNDFILMGVLLEESFKKNHIPGSINIPIIDTDTTKPVSVRDFKNRCLCVVPDKNTKIVVYCSDCKCSASKNAVRKLEYAGYKNVFVFKGGIEEWQEKGYPIIKGKVIKNQL